MHPRDFKRLKQNLLLSKAPKGFSDTAGLMSHCSRQQSAVAFFENGSDINAGIWWSFQLQAWRTKCIFIHNFLFLFIHIISLRDLLHRIRLLSGHINLQESQLPNDLTLAHTDTFCLVVLLRRMNLVYIEGKVLIEVRRLQYYVI